MINRELCERYPFLIPFNRWSGMRITDAKNGGFYLQHPDVVPDYDYEYTELDDMPDGWRAAFGEQMCEEIRDALLKNGGEDALDKYRVLQIKEKYGSLRWYDSCGNDDVDKIIRKYGKLSEVTCIRCGEHATKVSTGWISPFCDDCANEISKNGTLNIEFVPLLDDEEETV